MQIGPGLSPLAARAYGLHAPAARPVAPTAPAAAPERIGGAERGQSLVAGRVAGSVEFDGVAAPRRGDALTLYSRSADRVEAATRLGVNLDVHG